MELVYQQDDIELKWIQDSSEENGKNLATLKELYRNYTEELSFYSDKVIRDELPSPEGNPGVEYVTVWVDTPKGHEMAGFFLYSLYPYSFSKHDIHIGEFYIGNEHRKKGLGRTVAEMIISSAQTQHLDFSMYMIDKNDKAKKFWGYTFGIKGYAESFFKGSVVARPADRDDLRLYYWYKEE